MLERGDVGLVGLEVLLRVAEGDRVAIVLDEVGADGTRVDGAGLLLLLLREARCGGERGRGDAASVEGDAGGRGDAGAEHGGRGGGVRRVALVSDHWVAHADEEREQEGRGESAPTPP